MIIIIIIIIIIRLIIVMIITIINNNNDKIQVFSKKLCLLIRNIYFQKHYLMSASTYSY